MEMKERDEAFETLCKLSDRQFDPQAKKRVRLLMGRSDEEIKDELLGIIDDCVYAAWSSGFEITFMHWMWLQVGGSEEELDKRNSQLENKEIRKKMRERFKWECC